MRAVEREDQARERGGLSFGMVGMVDGGERRGLGEVKLGLLGGFVMAS